MKRFKSECPPDYGSYTFSYAEYALMEPGDSLSDIYRAGFLPYTGDTTIDEEIFYLARSVRVNMQFYRPSSENRRVDRKAQPRQLSMEYLEKPPFDSFPEEAREIGLQYASERFQSGSMDDERFRYVYERDCANRCFLFRKPEGGIVGFVLAGVDETSVHYWFSFFDTALMEAFPVGKWMMWKVIEWAEEKGHRFVYLGTCYGEKPLYKVRDFKGVEFFDGNGWNHNAHLLKKYCRLDNREDRTDLFKLKQQSR